MKLQLRTKSLLGFLGGAFIGTGIEQVNTAVVQFDEVVQTDVSSAEETACAAGELLSQVLSPDERGRNLTRLVTGGGPG